MPVHANVCPSCSAPITIPPKVGQMYCPFCATPLAVDRQTDAINLDIAEHITDAIADSAAATQVELRRLQLSQELSSLRAQLAHVNSEIRLYEREPQTDEVRRYLEELYAEAQGLDEHIADLRLALNPGGDAAQRQARPRPMRPAVTRPSRGATGTPQPATGAQSTGTGWLWLFFDVRGRISRGQFVVGLVAVAVVVSVATALIGTTDAGASEIGATDVAASDTPASGATESEPIPGADAESSELSPAACVAMPLLLAGLWMGVAIGVKRYHDRNKPGWWVLIGLIPLGIFWVIFELAFLPGTPAANRYGVPAAW